MVAPAFISLLDIEDGGFLFQFSFFKFLLFPHLNTELFLEFLDLKKELKHLPLKSLISEMNDKKLILVLNSFFKSQGLDIKV